MKLFFILIAIFSMSFSIHAQIYKCVREDGSVLFKDLPCRKQDLQTTYDYPLARDPQYAPSETKLMQRRKRLTQRRMRYEKKLAKEQNKRLRLESKYERVVHQKKRL